MHVFLIIMVCLRNGLNKLGSALFSPFVIWQSVSLHSSSLVDAFFFCLGFLSGKFTKHGTAGEGGGDFFNSSLPLPPAPQTLRHQPGDCCRELTSTYSWQPDWNREALVSECKSLTTKLRALIIIVDAFNYSVARSCCAARLSWKIFQNLKESIFVRVSIEIKLQVRSFKRDPDTFKSLENGIL